MKCSFEESEGDQCYRQKAKHNYRNTNSHSPPMSDHSNPVPGQLCSLCQFFPKPQFWQLFRRGAAALVSGDRLKSSEPSCAFPKLYRMPVYKQFSSLPSFRLVLHLKVKSMRYVSIAVD